MAWFTYSQNNSGGDFVLDKDRGLTHHVIIEARTPEEANDRAESIGMYWNGCADQRDCPCCGDRWDSAYGKGDQAPTIYGQPAEHYADWGGWMEDGYEIAIHPETGDVRWHGVLIEAE